MATIAERVQKGIDTLDAYFMGHRWFDDVELDKLDMVGTDCSCVLGQLDVKHNIWRLGGLTYNPSLGFDAESMGDFPKLHKEWAKRILELRSERA